MWLERDCCCPTADLSPELVSVKESGLLEGRGRAAYHNHGRDFVMVSLMCRLGGNGKKADGDALIREWTMFLESHASKIDVCSVQVRNCFKTDE